MRGTDFNGGWFDMKDFSVHPHMRGADVGLGVSGSYLPGSPPHAWGRFPRLLLANMLPTRFTPTCVGQIGAYNFFAEESLRFTPTCVGQIYPLVFLMRCVPRFTPTCVGQINAETLA